MKIRLETSTLCQLKCPSCINKSDEIKNFIGRGNLKFSDFKKIVNDNRWIKEIELSNWGEIFQNKEIGKIIEYAYVKNISLTACNGVNLNTVSNRILRFLPENLVQNIFKGSSLR